MQDGMPNSRAALRHSFAMKGHPQEGPLTQGWLEGWTGLDRAAFSEVKSSQDLRYY